MERIFGLCDTANVQVSLYRSSQSYTEMRWSCQLEGHNPSEGQEIKASADGLDAQAALELAWHRFVKLTSGEPALKALVSP